MCSIHAIIIAGLLHKSKLDEMEVDSEEDLSNEYVPLFIIATFLLINIQCQRKTRVLCFYRSLSRVTQSVWPYYRRRWQGRLHYHRSCKYFTFAKHTLLLMNVNTFYRYWRARLAQGLMIWGAWKVLFSNGSHLEAKYSLHHSLATSSTIEDSTMSVQAFCYAQWVKSGVMKSEFGFVFGFRYIFHNWRSLKWKRSFKVVNCKSWVISGRFFCTTITALTLKILGMAFFTVTYWWMLVFIYPITTSADAEI